MRESSCGKVRTFESSRARHQLACRGRAGGVFKGPSCGSMSLPLIAKDHTLAWLPVVEQRFPKPLQPILPCRCETICRNVVEEITVNLWFLKIRICDVSVVIDIKEKKLLRLFIASIVLSGGHGLFRCGVTVDHGFFAS